jgi:hypothetical protein
MVHFLLRGNGGSGGGSDAYGFPSAPANMAAGSGNTPPTSPPQGNDGGVGVYNSPNGSGRGGRRWWSYCSWNIINTRRKSWWSRGDN